MQAKARYRGDGSYTLTGSSSGASIVVDTGGDREPVGPRPTELVLFGAATCPAVDLLSILAKMRHPADDLIVEVDGERAESPPRRFTKVHLKFRVIGRGIPLQKARQAADLAVEQYCSVTASLNAEVSWECQVEEPGENAG